MVRIIIAVTFAMPHIQSKNSSHTDSRLRGSRYQHAAWGAGGDKGREGALVEKWGPSSVYHLLITEQGGRPKRVGTSEG